MESLLSDLKNFLFAVDDSAAREIWNGAWFALSIAMVISFLLISFQRIYSKRRKAKWFYYDIAFQISSALCVFSAGSAVRAGYVWLLLHCENLGGVGQCPGLEMYAWSLSIGAVLAIISGICIIRILSPPEWAPWVWVTAAFTSIGGPVIFYAATRVLNFGVTPESMAIEGRYDPFLVILSIVVPMIAAYAALELIGHSREVEGYSAWTWTAAAAIAMGGGIWSMHFIAMLSFSLHGVPIGYDVMLTTLSLLIPMVVTLVGFLAIKDSYPGGFIPLIVSGTFIGIGIVTMHYTGMAAMRMPLVDIAYNPLLFGLSVLIAVVASISSVWVAFSGSIAVNIIERKILAAIIGGTAVAGMHYTGMAATTFHHKSRADISVVAINQTELALWVAGALALILITFISALVYDRRKRTSNLQS